MKQTVVPFHDCSELFLIVDGWPNGNCGKCWIRTPNRPILQVDARLCSLDRPRAKSDRSCRGSTKLSGSEFAHGVPITVVAVAFELNLLLSLPLASNLVFVCVCAIPKSCEDDFMVPSKLIAPRRCRTSLKSSRRMLSVKHLKTNESFQYGLILF